MRHALAALAPLAAVLLLFTALRWIFYFTYRTSFPFTEEGTLFWTIIQGLRFDAMTIVLANAPWVVPSLFPWPWSDRRVWRLALRILFVVVNALVLLVCCIDLPFYGFNGKRLTSDALGQTEAGLRELPSMMLNYWWATALFILAVIVVVRASKWGSTPANGNVLTRTIIAVAMCGLVAL
ncbi:MAG TPA: hypothetical protein PK760_06735, partial [Flavobacteriales bacterium]|nr:hypothetical protein [Flavobacteriales bacterium]